VNSKILVSCLPRPLVALLVEGHVLVIFEVSARVRLSVEHSNATGKTQQGEERLKARFEALAGVQI
jgi:hypothetical protein